MLYHAPGLMSSAAGFQLRSAALCADIRIAARVNNCAASVVPRHVQGGSARWGSGEGVMPLPRIFGGE